MGLVFKATGQRDWMASHAQVPCPILLEDRIRVFFATRKRVQGGRFYESNTGFFDVSRSDPTKLIGLSERPVIHIGLPGSFSQHGISPSHALYENGEVQLYYAGWSRQIGIPYQIAIGLAHSGDHGQTFEKVGEGPVIDRAPHEPFGVNSVWVDQSSGSRRMIYSGVISWNLESKISCARYLLFSAESTTGLEWQRSDVSILPPSDREDCQCVPSVIATDRKYHLWYSHRKGSNYRSASGGYTISYANSEDFNCWKTQDTLSFDHSGHGFDSEMVCYPAAIEVDGELLLFYCGNGFGESGIGLAFLKGGFANLNNFTS